MRCQISLNVCSCNYFYTTEKYINKFGVAEVFGNVIDELNKLAQDGLVLNINGEDIKVFFVNGLFIGRFTLTSSVLRNFMFV